MTRIAAALAALALAVPALASDVSSDRDQRMGPAATSARQVPTTTDQARALAGRPAAPCSCHG